MTLQRILLVLTLAFLANGCQEPGTEDLPFAASAPPAGLVVNLRRPEGSTTRALRRPVRAPRRARWFHHRGAHRRQGRRRQTLARRGIVQAKKAQIAEFPSNTGFLFIAIGDEGEESSIEEFFDVEPFPGDIQEVVIGSIPPGFDVPVLIQVFDTKGSLLGEDFFFLDFFPGEIVSNDFLLDGQLLDDFEDFDLEFGEEIAFFEDFEGGDLNAFTTCSTQGSPFPQNQSGIGVDFGFGPSRGLAPGGGLMGASPGVGSTATLETRSLPDPDFIAAFGSLVRIQSGQDDKVLVGLAPTAACPSLDPSNILEDVEVGVLVERDVLSGDFITTPVFGQALLAPGGPVPPPPDGFGFAGFDVDPDGTVVFLQTDDSLVVDGVGNPVTRNLSAGTFRLVVRATNSSELVTAAVDELGILLIPPP